MSFLRSIVALIMLTTWSACAINCEIEAAFDQSSCCSEPANESQHGAPDTPLHCLCGTLQCGGFVSMRKADAADFPAVAFLIIATDVVAEASEAEPVPRELISSPPELLHGWQFFCLAAASPRAPSFVS